MVATNGQLPTPASKLRWYQFSLRTLLVFTTLTAILVSAARIPGARLVVLLLAWLVLLFMLMAAGARGGEGVKLRWAFACCQALAAVYGPLIVAITNTWLSDGTNSWLRADMWKSFLAVPGGVCIEVVALTIWHRHPDMSPTAALVLCGLLTGLMLAVSAWSAVKTRRARWAVLPLINILCAYGALFLDAAMRM